MPTGPELARWIRESGAFIRTGPFTIHVRTSIERAIDGIAALYDNYPASREEAFADFHVELTRAGGLRRWIRPQVNFEFDGAQPYRPLPLEQALPMFEWGLNAVISNNAHQYLIVHAAAVARDGFAAILPGPPGAGKSTLCAALVNRGWRLLTDEMTLLVPETGLIHALARPVNLKNALDRGDAQLRARGRVQPADPRHGQGHGRADEGACRQRRARRRAGPRRLGRPAAL